MHLPRAKDFLDPPNLGSVAIRYGTVSPDEDEKLSGRFSSVNAPCSRFSPKPLNRAQRLSPAFLDKLLGWNPSGFSVYANQLVFTKRDDEPDRLERLARYLTRAPLGVDTLRTKDDGQVEVSTPPLPRTPAAGSQDPGVGLGSRKPPRQARASDENGYRYMARDRSGGTGSLLGWLVPV